MNINDIIERLLLLDTPGLCDANKDIRVMDAGIRPIDPGRKMIGRAFTVRCHDDYLAVIRALRDSAPGDVLVVDGQGGRRALAGELFASEAAHKGLKGIVVDGAVRDSASLRRIPLPVWSRDVYPNAGTTRETGENAVPVTCGGVEVNPGDIVFGDADGIVVASAVELEQLLPLAEDIQANEARVLERMAEGRSLIGMLNFDHHDRAIADGDHSTLEFTG